MPQGPPVGVQSRRLSHRRAVGRQPKAPPRIRRAKKMGRRADANLPPHNPNLFKRRPAWPDERGPPPARPPASLYRLGRQRHRPSIAKMQQNAKAPPDPLVQLNNLEFYLPRHKFCLPPNVVVGGCVKLKFHKCFATKSTEFTFQTLISRIVFS